MANISQNWLIEKKDLDIFEIFSNEYNIEIHGSEAAKILKMPQRSVARKLEKLSKTGILRFKRAGKNKVYSVNWESPLANKFMVLTETYKSIKFLSENPKLAIILNEIESGMIIFGSYAKKHKNPEDLDIVFLDADEKKAKQAITKLSVEVHPQFITIKEFREKLKKKEALLTEIAKNHVVINKYDEIIRIFREFYNG